MLQVGAGDISVVVILVSITVGLGALSVLVAKSSSGLVAIDDFPDFSTTCFLYIQNSDFQSDLRSREIR